MQYAFLNEIQQEDPLRIIYACAGGDTIFKDRRLLFNIFYAAIGSEIFQDQDAHPINDYLYCWQRMVTMIEACHRFAELKLDKQVHYSYTGDVIPK